MLGGRAKRAERGIMLFSQRLGKTPIRFEVQIDSMDDALRNKLWNIFTMQHFANGFESSGIMSPRVPNSKLYSKLKIIWHHFLKQTIDTMPDTEEGIIHTVKNMFFSNKWYFVYDLIEFTIKFDSDKDFIELYNNVLESEKSAYRIVNKNIIKITEESEIENVNAVLDLKEPFSIARKHIETSIILLANRTNPDYRNSIKESISAVEATCRIITNSSSDTLGKALSKLEKVHGLHKALGNGFSSLYGYSSDADGIRHAMMDIPNLEYSDAIFYLVICSAFVNYLVSKLGE
jgi:hypothetical protein